MKNDLIKANNKKRNSGLWTIMPLIFFLCTCTYDNLPRFEYASEGIITGPDYKLCPCCGGWEITIDNISYRFSSLPTNSGINLDKEKFPLKVTLNWTLDNTGCKWIVISQIAKI